MKKIVSLFIALALVLCIAAPCLAADSGVAEYQANQLKIMGLFQGVSDTNFDLDREPTRTEALVMLIRLLGKEDEALAGSDNNPFTDVATWADKYVGYAYENGLTNGVSATNFGAKDTATSNMYSTFVLRALGYDDSAGDFSWKTANELASQLGILTDDVDTESFLRADAVLVSYAALDAPLKDGTQTLGEKLDVPDLSEYIGTYDMTKETEDGVVVTGAEGALYLHADGTMALYDGDDEIDWIYGTWTIKNGILYTNDSTYGTDKGTLNGNSLTLTNAGWTGYLQKVEADKDISSYPGTYKVSYQSAGSKEAASIDMMLYLHADGSMIYTLPEYSTYANGTWSVKDGIITTKDDSYGESTGTLDDGTFKLDSTPVETIYQKTADNESSFAADAGTYKLTHQTINGKETVTGDQEKIYLHADGTSVSFTQPTVESEFRWINGTWSLKGNVITTNSDLYGTSTGTLEGNSISIIESEDCWQGSYQKATDEADLADYAGTYELTSQEIEGLVNVKTGEMLYLHGDGTLAYTWIQEKSEFVWVYGTWSVKNGTIYIEDAMGGASEGTSKDGLLTSTYHNSLTGSYKKLDAAAEKSEYVGKYKMTSQASDGVEEEYDYEDMLYLMANGTMAYTGNSDSGCRWIYGTWSVEDGVVSLIDDTYGLGLGTLDGDTFAWKDYWTGYFDKVTTATNLADYVGTYELSKEVNKGTEVTTTEGVLYLQEDGTFASYYKDVQDADDDNLWLSGTWGIKNGTIYTNDDIYGYAEITIDNDNLCWLFEENWTGYYQKTEDKATLAKYVGAYEITKEETNGQVTVANGEIEMLYLHGDGTTAYTFANSSEKSGYKWIYGTWSIKNGAISLWDDAYGASTATISGNTIIWVDNWIYYYQKLN